MVVTNVAYHVHGTKPEGRFSGSSCWIHADMNDRDCLSVFFTSPDDVRATIASLTDALAQWEAHLASKEEEA